MYTGCLGHRHTGLPGAASHKMLCRATFAVWRGFGERSGSWDANATIRANIATMLQTRHAVSGGRRSTIAAVSVELAHHGAFAFAVNICWRSVANPWPKIWQSLFGVSVKNPKPSAQVRSMVMLKSLEYIGPLVDELYLCVCDPLRRWCKPQTFGLH